MTADEARRVAALALLREVEWAGSQNGQDTCPVCCGYRQDPGGDLLGPGGVPGHAPDCRLAALLKG